MLMKFSLQQTQKPLINRQSDERKSRRNIKILNTIIPTLIIDNVAQHPCKIFIFKRMVVYSNLIRRHKKFLNRLNQNYV